MEALTLSRELSDDISSAAGEKEGLSIGSTSDPVCGPLWAARRLLREGLNATACAIERLFQDVVPIMASRYAKHAEVRMHRATLEAMGMAQEAAEVTRVVDAILTPNPRWGESEKAEELEV